MDDGMLTNRDHARLMAVHSQEIEKINNSILRTLKNTNNENKLLDREIERMQRIDRVKVAHAKTSIFVPEMGNVFPSLDMYYAANKNQTQSTFQSVDINQNNERDIFSPTLTNRNVVTANEISGVCERFGGGRDQTGAPL